MPDYSSSKVCFDNESQLVVALDNFGWSDEDQPHLIEHYLYDRIVEVSKPTDEDFSEKNPTFHFMTK